MKKALIAAALVSGSFAHSAAAQSPAEFYRGKTVELIIGFGTGGSNDTYSRMLSTHIGKHIPGSPTVVLRNMPGAGSFIAVNQIYAASPKDGTVIGLGSPTLALDEKLGTAGVRFKTAELNWIGRIGPLVNIVFTSSKAKAQTLVDVRTHETTLSGTGAGSTASIYPLVLNKVLGTKFKLVMGYKTSSEGMLAVERGEVEGHSTAYEAVRAAKPAWLSDGTITIISQFGLKRLPELPNVPTAIESARTDEERQILTAIMSASEIGTSYFTTPETPSDRVTALRRAFDATMKDDAFTGDLKRMRMSSGPVPGEEVQTMVAEFTKMSPALLEKVRAAYTN